MLSLVLHLTLALRFAARDGWRRLRGGQVAETSADELHRGGVALLMFVALTGELWLLVRLLEWALAERAAAAGVDGLALLVPLTPFALLGLVLAGMHGLRLGLRR